MKTVEVKCSFCGKTIQKPKNEYNRRKRMGKDHFYCNLSCAGKTKNNKKHLSKVRSGYEVWLHSPYKGDEFSVFRSYAKKARERSERKGREFNLTLEYLKELWEEQDGKCPFTAWRLIPRDYKNRDKIKLLPNHASLDRIDNSKGYIEGNVRFVAVMYNFARNVFTDQDVIDFCRQVVDYNRNE